MFILLFAQEHSDYRNEKFCGNVGYRFRGDIKEVSLIVEGLEMQQYGPMNSDISMYP